MNTSDVEDLPTKTILDEHLRVTERCMGAVRGRKRASPL
jgi:hypothetical protein